MHHERNALVANQKRSPARQEGGRVEWSDRQFVFTKIVKMSLLVHVQEDPIVVTTMATSSNVYETNESLNMYLGLHFSSSLTPLDAHEHAPSTAALAFPQRVAELLVKLSGPKFGIALDVGCAVSGTAFELAKTFQHVEAFDFSENFIATASRIQVGEIVSFKVRMEGDFCKEAQVNEIHYSDRVKFLTGDACQLVKSVGEGVQYDAVVLANLLCRVPDPDACLAGLPQVVKTGGVVLLVTPFTWLEEYAPRDKWIGGKDGRFGIQVLEDKMSTLGFSKRRNATRHSRAPAKVPIHCQQSYRMAQDEDIQALAMMVSTCIKKYKFCTLGSSMA